VIWWRLTEPTDEDDTLTNRLLLMLACLGALAPSGLGWTAETPAVWSVPKVDGVVIDGKLDDWKNAGLALTPLISEDGKPPPKESLDAQCRLGWDDRGLLLRVTVQEDIPVESADGWSFYQKDSIEVFSLDRLGGTEQYQSVFSPGVDPRYPELRQLLVDHRGNKNPANLTVEVARTKTDKGYALEALMPWANIHLQGEVGRELAFQIYVNHGTPTGKYQLIWFPRTGAHHDNNQYYRIQLTTGR
jgi:hypothetical protein